MIFDCSNPACRCRIEIDDSMSGRRVECPKCATVLVVPDQSDIHFICINPECSINIMADASQAGRFLQCPVCRRRQRVPGTPVWKRVVSRWLHSLHWKDLVRVPVSPWRRLVWGWSVGAVLLAVLLWGFQIHSRAMVTVDLDRLADEVFEEGGLIEAPTENGRGDLLYIRRNRNDLDVMRVNLSTLIITRIMRVKDAAWDAEFKWLGWSPGGHYLAYITKPGEKRQLSLCDGYTGKLLETFNAGFTLESRWLTSNTLTMVWAKSRPELVLLNVKASRQLGRFGAKGMVSVGAVAGAGRMEPDSDHSMCYVGDNSIWSFDFATEQTNLLARLGSRIPEDLHFSPQSKRYLFTVLEEKNSEHYHVWQLDPQAVGNARLVQLTTNSSRWPRWIEGGTGVSLVETNRGREFLRIITPSGTRSTNLFVGGDIFNYSVGSFGNRIYATVRDDRGIWRFWEYDIPRQSLRKIHSEQRYPTVRRMVPTVVRRMTNAIGETGEYFFMPPAGLESGGKYPVIIDTFSAHPPEVWGQFFANAGMYYVSPNRQGVTLWSDVPKYEDILAVYKLLIEDPTVDPQRIYITGQSVSTIVTSRVVDDHPRWWRGVLLLTPGSWPRSLMDEVQRASAHDGVDPRKNPESFPSLFLSYGDREDPDAMKLCEYAFEEMSSNFSPARIDFQIGGEHAYRPYNKSESCKAMARFILTGY